MAWNPDPKVAEARDYGEKYEKDMVIIISASLEDGEAEVISYGKTRKMCDRAKEIAEEVLETFLNNW